MNNKEDPGAVSPRSVDAAFGALLGDRRNFLRPPPSHVTIDRVRAAAKQAMATLPGPPLEKVEDCPEARLRLYTPTASTSDAAILFLHGGGFVLGDLDTHDGICRRLAVAAGVPVAAVDYRLAPETPHPGAVDDACRAMEWLIRKRGVDPSRLAFAGDSAGAYVALLAALRPETKIAYLVLIYPILDPSCSSDTAHRYGEDYILTKEAIKWFWRCYLQGQTDPLMDIEMTALPPTTILTAGFDPLRSEGEVLAERLRAAGVNVIQRHYAQMIHGFLGMPHLTSVAEDAILALAEDVRAAIA